ncbi:hypothetical protein V6N13_147256 [Hibiscus sabdariffa]
MDTKSKTSQVKLTLHCPPADARPQNAPFNYSEAMADGREVSTTRVEDDDDDKYTCEPCRSVGERCSLLVKKQRAKFYILRRCIAMLVCWRETAES